MPIIKAAIKALRQSEKRRKINRVIKNRVKENIKSLVKFAKNKQFEELKQKLPKVYGLIDKAAKKHIFHKNNAARKKSRLAHLLAPLSGAK